MAETGYRVKIVNGDFHFEVEGDKAFVKEMLKQYVSESVDIGFSAPASSSGTVTKEKPTKSTSKSISIGEFVRQLGVKRHTDIVLAFGYYLEKYSGRESFTTADINSCYYDAKLESSNTTQMITQNIKSSRIMSAKSGGTAKSKGKKYFVLTRTGEEFIDKKLLNPTS